MELKNLPDIDFIKKSLEEILNENIAEFEKSYVDLNGEPKKLYPGDKMRIYIYTKSLREYQLLYLINELAKQNMLRYATGTPLRHLGDLFNTEIIDQKKAISEMNVELTKTFEINYVIPGGTRFTPGNKIYYETLMDQIIEPGNTSALVPVTCLDAGTIGNDFVPGQINILVDSHPFIDSVSNTVTSSGGAEEEDEESYKERIRLAPSSFTTTGTDDAYIALTKKYSTDIDDVHVHSPTPGVVEIVVAMKSGIPSAEELAAILAFVSDKKKRTFTDNVQVVGATPSDYIITLTYYISSNDSLVESEINTKVTAAVDDYKNWQKDSIGKHINPSKLHDLITEAGASRIVITLPIYKQLTAIELANATVSNITYGGLENDGSI